MASRFRAQSAFVLTSTAPISIRKSQTRSAVSSASATGGVSESEWRVLSVPDRYLRLNITLSSGQSFLWKEIGTFTFGLSHTGVAREWAGAIRDQLFILRQAHPRPPDVAPDPVWYRVVAEEMGQDSVSKTHDVIEEYFRAKKDHTKLMQSFREADSVFNEIFPYYKGLRTLRLDPTECLFGYICSANNHLRRISTMVTGLTSRYGKLLGSHGGREFYSFPTAEAIAENSQEEELRRAGMGYRAKYIGATAKALVKLAEEEGKSVEEMLLSWRKLGREEVAEKLIQFAGVGRKVAGCIALMSLDKHGEIPVDTHVWRIAQRYMPDLESKSLTKRIYNRIGEFFRERFGEDVAGIAHNVLFVGELAEFRKMMPERAAMQDRQRRENAGRVKKTSGKKVKEMEDGNVRRSVKRVRKSGMVRSKAEHKYTLDENAFKEGKGQLGCEGLKGTEQSQQEDTGRPKRRQKAK